MRKKDANLTVPFGLQFNLPQALPAWTGQDKQRVREREFGLFIHEIGTIKCFPRRRKEGK